MGKFILIETLTSGRQNRWLKKREMFVTTASRNRQGKEPMQAQENKTKTHVKFIIDYASTHMCALENEFYLGILFSLIEFNRVK